MPRTLPDCEYRDDHPKIARDVKHLEYELERVDRERRSNEGRLFEKLDGLAQRLSHLEGRIVGYLLAGSVLTAILVFIAQKVLHGS